MGNQNSAGQTANLLTTKIFRPSSNGNLINRPALLNYLGDGRQYKLILISAPAGFGKTTLANEWLEHNKLATAWLSLEETDNDPVQFWSYVALALEPKLPGISQTIVNLPGVLPPSSKQQFLISFTNRLTELKEELVLVLDDYHFITSSDIQEGVAFLLDHLPPRLHLLITSRADPQLPLARLRSRQEVVELRAEHLRFTSPEITSFFNSLKGLNLPSQDIEVLEERTEGWAAALQLAALSIENSQNVKSFIKAFKGTDRFMLDYLTQEVLYRQPQDVQNFLLQTSILNNLTASLVETLTGCEDGQAMLERLEHTNLFVVALDKEQKWYRYHHLFREYLRNHLYATQAEHIPLLHRWAAQWYEEQKLLSQAIPHALAYKDYEYTADLLEQVVDKAIQSGEFKTVLNWFEPLPEEVILARLNLALDLVWVLALIFQITRAEEWLEKIIASLTLSQQDKRVGVKLDFLKALIALHRNDFDQTIKFGRLALEGHEDTQSRAFLGLGVMFILAVANTLKGDLIAAETELHNLITHSRRANQLPISLMATEVLCFILILRGKLTQADKLSKEVFQYSANSSQSEVITVGAAESVPPFLWAYLAAGEIAREWYELDRASALLEKCIEIAKTNGSEDFAYIGYIFLARVKQNQNDEPGARQALLDSELIAQNHPLQNSSLAINGIVEVWVWLGLGQTHMAVRTLERYKELSEVEHNELYELAVAKVLVAQGQLKEANVLLEGLYHKIEPDKWTRMIVEVRLLEACVHYKLNQPKPALSKLVEALQVAEPEKFTTMFAEAGQAVVELLPVVLERCEDYKVSPLYLNHLLEVCTKNVDEKPVFSQPLLDEPSRSPKIGEALTERELDVLRLLVNTSLKTTEIANELVVAVSTVRFHIKNIYSKLDVQTRFDAIQRSQQLHLLDHN